MTDVAGHFGEWLQGRLGPDGPVVLVTCPCPVLRVSPAAGPALFPADSVERFCAALGTDSAHWPELACDMPPGGGAGASTAWLVAGARAVAPHATAEQIARACLSVEGACDPLMFPDPDRLLWASREGRIVERLSAPPRCEVVGGFWGAPTRTDPADHAFPEVDDLVTDWRRAVTEADLGIAAGIATASATRCDALRGPGDPMTGLARDLKALGVVRAHTGSARGLIFAPGAVPATAEPALREAGLTQVLHFTTGQRP
ncbi:hypothetical protein [Sagittula stellata]|uniref:Propanediol utilization protein n=1 Tax=Sagittula stellata (strain ATCC 700073 / DSM 11524 / E-37) TaxID=388399 RepID=A3K460_SAGS3|nr:hypothetical protein [Sagittula stellata]EBA08324.1 hypothetical protein SSE37_12289 [Sagittula stellata E-37]